MGATGIVLCICALTALVTTASDNTEEFHYYTDSGFRMDVIISVAERDVCVVQGRDEERQEACFKIWGEVNIKSLGLVEIDEDEVPEFAILSRNSGSAPYYKLQLIDLQESGIRLWSYDSYGEPKVENGNVLLGYADENDLPGNYKVYHLGLSGLILDEQ